MDDTLIDKKALIVGGSSGIGYYLAQSLIKEGAFVTIQGKNKTDKWDAFYSQRNSEGLICDLQDSSAIDELLKKAQYTDILCVAYGPFLQKSLDAVSADEWADIVYANLTLPGILVSTVLSYMKKKCWGRILLFGGTETHILRGFKTNAVYGAAKMGIMSLVRSISMAYAPFGITANAICPGFTDTPRLTLEQRKNWEKKNPDGVLLSPEAIASAALFLLKNSACNGVLMPIDKGWSSFTEIQEI